MANEYQGYIQVVMDPTIREAFSSWLAPRHLNLSGPINGENDEDLPTFIIGIDQDFLEGIKEIEAQNEELLLQIRRMEDGS